MIDQMLQQKLQIQGYTTFVFLFDHATNNKVPVIA